MTVTRLVRYATTVIITMAVLLLLWQFSTAILLFLMSLAVAAALRPLIGFVMEKSKSRRVALGTVYMLIILAIVGAVMLVGPRFLDELQRASDDFAANYDLALTQWPNSNSVFKQALAENLPPSSDLYQALTTDEGVPALQGVFGFAQNFFSVLGQLAIVIVLSLYWSADQLRFERLGLSILPEEYHSKALHAWRSIEAGVGAYLRSEVAQSIVAGFMLWLLYTALGIRYPVLLALWGAVARLIPWFGTIIAVIPVMLVAISSTVIGIIATVCTIAIQYLLTEIIEPRVFYRYKYSSLLIVLFVIAFAQAFGFIGVILAPPTAVALQILFEQLYPFPASVYSQETSEKVKNIRARLLQLRRRIQRHTGRRNRLLVNRIYYLVKRTADYLEGY